MKVYFENKAVLYILDIKFTIVPARVFKMKYASHIPANDQVSINYNRNPYHEDSIKMSCLEIEDCFNGCLHDDWVTVEGSLDAVKNCDCVGHFYKSCAVSMASITVSFSPSGCTNCLSYHSLQTKACNSSFARSLPQRRSHWSSHLQAYRSQHPLQEVPQGKVC